MDADNFLRNRICKHYDKVDKFVSGGLNYSISEEYADHYEPEEEYYDGAYRYEELTPEQCKRLYEAVIEDAKAGKLQPYNGVYYYDYAEEEQVIDKVSYYAELNFTYELPEEERENTEETNYYMDSNMIWAGDCYFNFGPDCTNIINALIESGVIESEEQIRWYY